MDLLLPISSEIMQARVLVLGVFFLLLWPLSTSAQSQVIIEQFSISSEGADVLLVWNLPQEDAIREFRLFRRINDEPTSAHLATLDATGALQYTYLDDDIFKTESRTLHYELQVIMHPGQIHRFSRSLSHNPTSVQRTWGSIKAMFRY